MRGGDRREPHIPFQAIDQRGMRQVGRPDVGGVKTGVAAQQPRLGVQPGAVGFVVDPHLGAELVHQRIERSRVRGAQVRRGDDPQRDSTLPQLGEFVAPADAALAISRTHTAGRRGQRWPTRRRNSAASVGSLRALVISAVVRQRRRRAWKRHGAQCLHADRIETPDLGRVVLVQGLGQHVSIAKHRENAAQQLARSSAVPAARNWRSMSGVR